MMSNSESIQYQIIDAFKQHTVKFELSSKSPDTIHHLVDTSLKCSGSTYALANLIFFLYNEKYVVSRLKTKSWYFHDGIRWISSEVGPYYELSTEIVSIYECLKASILHVLDEHMRSDAYNENKDGITNLFLEKSNKCDRIIEKLKNVNSKENICKECVYMFYNPNFMSQIDRNPYLVCFRNGVLDLQGNKFRKGEPSDMITIMIDMDFKSPLYMRNESVDKTQINALIEQFQIYRKNINEQRHIKIKTLFSKDK